MRRSFLPALWAILYVICAAAGCIPSPQGFVSVFLVAMSILFFVPPAVMLYQAIKETDLKTVRIIRNISIAWLITAVILILCNIFSVMASELTGIVLYYIMVVVTAPMVCGQSWFVSLFLWACLLIVSQQQLRKIK